jgi:elongation factor Ts
MNALIKQLRQETGAGMMDCKKALDQHQGNVVLAKEALLKKVETSIGNERVASKGLCGIRVLEHEAILYELNAETDFAWKNEHFVKLVKEVGDVLVQTAVTNPRDALNVSFHGMTLHEKITQVSGIIKESIQLRRFYRVVKSSQHAFGTYVHLGGKVVTLVILDQDNQKLADELAMQVAANSPKYLSLEMIDQHTKDFERFMFEKEYGTGDDQTFLKHLSNMTLLNEVSIKHPEISVDQLLKTHHATVLDFFRFELGQGIENKLNCRLDIPCDGSKITVTPIF